MDRQIVMWKRGGSKQEKKEEMEEAKKIEGIIEFEDLIVNGLKMRYLN